MGNNTAVGGSALGTNTTGDGNTALGNSALDANTSGASNTASGAFALFVNTTGNGNVANGVNSLLRNTGGAGNTAIGTDSMHSNTVGSRNVYVGSKGKNEESQTLRIGQDQSRAFIAGISGTPVSGSTVLVNAMGQLGILASSARYKRDVEDMARAARRCTISAP